MDIGREELNGGRKQQALCSLPCIFSTFARTTNLSTVEGHCPLRASPKNLKSVHEDEDERLGECHYLGCFLRHDDHSRIIASPSPQTRGLLTATGSIIKQVALEHKYVVLYVLSRTDRVLHRLRLLTWGRRRRLAMMTTRSPMSAM
jgi:hypothetical protein